MTQQEPFEPTKYDAVITEPDPYWCPLLQDNLGKYQTPRGYYDWHKSIWTYKVNPENFGPDVFQPNCLLIDPFATVRGALWGSLYFQLLFAAFPNLSGKHVSFAANESQIFINWGFLTTAGRAEIFVPATDIFCLKGGLVNYRLSTFDVATLIHALISAYGGTDPVLEANLKEIMWRWHVDRDYATAALPALKARRAARQ